MANPSILIPRGLAALHPQLELSLKSIKARIDALQAQPGGVSAAQLLAIQQQLTALNTRVNALIDQIDALPVPEAPSLARHFMLSGA